MLILLAILLDYLLGEPRRYHPLVGFGKIGLGVESFLHSNSRTETQPIKEKLAGVISVLALIMPVISGVALLAAIPLWGKGVDLLVLYLSIGGKSLSTHAGDVANALRGSDIALARQKVSLIVSRDTASMQESDIARAAIESVLENGNDAVFGAIFWFLVLGAPGVVLYRLANTLDAMWGYKNKRYLYFGWAAARLDDVLNWIPARLTAISYALVGNARVAWQCWRRQAGQWYSPNAGPVMASGAGALCLELGGPAVYHGILKVRPVLGRGNVPGFQDIERAVNLVHKATLLWMMAALLLQIGQIM